MDKLGATSRNNVSSILQPGSDQNKTCGVTLPQPSSYDTSMCLVYGHKELLRHFVSASSVRSHEISGVVVILMVGAVPEVLVTLLRKLSHMHEGWHITELWPSGSTSGLYDCITLPLDAIYEQDVTAPLLLVVYYLHMMEPHFRHDFWNPTSFTVPCNYVIVG